MMVIPEAPAGTTTEEDGVTYGGWEETGGYIIGKAGVRVRARKDGSVEIHDGYEGISIRKDELPDLVQVLEQLRDAWWK